MKAIRQILHLIIALLLILNCDLISVNNTDDNEDREPKETDHTELGWVAFHNEQYMEAIKHFKAAIAENSTYSDAYNGLGWAYMRLDSLSFAYSYFTIAINDNARTSWIIQDASAGRAFVNLALDQFEQAIEDVNRIENFGLTADDYVFRHDQRITLKRLYLLKAECCFLLAQYEACAAIVIELGYDLKAFTPTALAQAIEVLKASMD